MPLTKHFRFFLLSIALVLGGGVLPVSFAGPEAIPDYSKDKNPIVEIPTVCEPKWYLSIGGGGDFNIGGSDLSHGFSRDFTAQTIGGPFPARVNGDSHDWNDAFDDAWHIQGELGYRWTSHIETFSSFRYAHAEGVHPISGGTVLVDLTGVGGGVLNFPFTRDFGDYTSYGSASGIRYFFLSKEARLRPYISLSAGFNHTDSIDISTRVDVSSVGGPRGLPIYKGGFFDDTWVMTGSAMLGLEYRVTCHWALGLEGGVRYESQLDDNDSDYKGLAFIDGIAAVPLRAFRPSNDDAGDRWTVPVNGYLKFRF